MPKDDYFAIVYKILEYLYSCMRSGETIDIEKISWDSKAIDINKSYWEDVIRSMNEEGYIRGVILINALGQVRPAVRFGDLGITQKGIEYLQDNSKMKKAAGCVKTVAEILKMFI